MDELWRNRKRCSMLSEHDSKQLLKEYGIPIVQEILVKSQKAAVAAADVIGFPVVLKGCSADLAHKTEMDVIRLNLHNAKVVRSAFREIKASAPCTLDGILVQKMIKGERELVMGMVRDAQFGPCVMFGLGGIYTEILNAVSFGIAPLSRRDALEMMNEIPGSKILESYRGMNEADRESLARSLIALGQLGLDKNDIDEIDINPVILTRAGEPVAVDALVVMKDV
jgi:acyl-CoA synthetase (NDP forming)